MTKVLCNNVTCYLIKIEVETHIERCLACGQVLKTPTEALFGRLFNQDDLLGSIFGRNYRR